MMIAALPWLLIGISGIVFELFGSVGYEKFLRVFHIDLTLGQVQLIGLISFAVTILLFLIRRALPKE